MLLFFLCRVCVLTSFATLGFMLSSPLRADLPTARIALQSRQFQLALAKWNDLEITFAEKRRVRERKISVNLSNHNLNYLGLPPWRTIHFSIATPI